jgi:hypothetical protein
MIIFGKIFWVLVLIASIQGLPISYMSFLIVDSCQMNSSCSGRDKDERARGVTGATGLLIISLTGIVISCRALNASSSNNKNK